MGSAGDSGTPWYVLVVDDKETVARDTSELLNRTLNTGSPANRILAVPERSFEEALKILGRGGVDLLVLDVIQQGETTPELDGELRGIDVFQQVRSTRFLPIVFLTALPNKVQHYKNPPFVHVVSKQADDFNTELTQCISECLSSPFPRLSRELQNHIDRISRDFMIEFVEKNWNELLDNEGDIAHLLMRRLGASFDNGGDLFKEESGDSPPPSEKVPPIRYYIVPPPDEYRMGDILKLSGSKDNCSEHDGQWYIVMTPTCDFTNDKADSVVVVECTALEGFGEYQKWTESKSNEARKKLVRLLKSNPTSGQRDRYYYLPKAWNLPDLIVDFQKILHVPYGELTRYDKQASMDSPYAESLSHQFNSYMSRIGTPDLDIDSVVNRMGL